MLTRRGALKTLFVAAAGATAAGRATIAAAGSGARSVWDQGGKIADWVVDTASGTIRYCGNGERKYTVLEFHRFLQEEAEKCQPPLPNYSNRLTDEIVTLKDLQFEASATEHLSGGAVIDGEGGVWQDFP